MVATMSKKARYVPTLRGKSGELSALAHLSPLAKSWTVPIIDIPKPPHINALEVSEQVAERITTLRESWGTANELYIDLSRYGTEGRDDRYSHPVTDTFKLARQCRLKALPICGTTLTRGPETAYFDAVSDIAKIDGRGLAIRLIAFEFVSPESAVKELITTMELLGVGPSDCDIILDFEAFDRLPTNLQEKGLAISVVTEAIYALGRLECRSVTICGSSIPERVGKKYDAAPFKAQRLELEIWKDLQDTIRPQSVGFGDYGVVYAFQPDGGAPVQPPCRARVSTDGAHVLYRSPPNSYRSLRARVRHDGILRNLPDCWGSRSILGQGGGFTGVGNATKWVAWDTNLHLEVTCRIVRGHSRLEEAGQLAGGDADRSPWLQSELAIVDEP